MRRRFSATQFWQEVEAEGATIFAYVGELCRYLVNQPERADERRHGLRLAFGNGLRKDVWEAMAARFAIPRVLEFYGATEGNVSLINFDGHVGAVGRVPKFLRRRFNVRLAAHDFETGEVLRDARGLAMPVRPGEVGEMLGAIDASDARQSFAGYADRAATERKVLRDVVARGDTWFPHRRPDAPGCGGILLLHRPHRRHLPLEGRERLDRRGGGQPRPRAGGGAGQPSTAWRSPARRAAPAWPPW